MRVALILALALAGCATAKKRDFAACEMNVEQQNDALNAAIERTFGKQPHGYNTQVSVPRARDGAGRIVLEAYRIYPIVLPEPEDRPQGRKLTVVIDPCARKVVRVAEPA